MLMYFISDSVTFKKEKKKIENHSKRADSSNTCKFLHSALVWVSSLFLTRQIFCEGFSEGL